LQTQLITLTSDFGTNDGSVMLLKLAILKALPNAVFTDFSHSIKPFQISHASYLVDNLFQQFDDGTIHLILVNVYAAIENELKAVRYKNHLFIAFDNGIFSSLFKDEKIEIISLGPIHESHFFYQHMAKAIVDVSTKTNEIWKSNVSNDYKKLLRNKFKITENTITGSVWLVDDFGNLITNIHRNVIEPILTSKKMAINYGYKAELNTISPFIFSAPTYEPVAYFNQFGYLEIAIRNYNLNRLFNINEGDIVTITYE
jgi:S-adenosylmethionine hydrolase